MNIPSMSILKKIKVWYIRNNINIPKLPVYIRFPGMSEYISTYQVHRHTCRHKNQRNKYVNITMKCQYVYKHTKYANLIISIPSMSKCNMNMNIPNISVYISTYQVWRNIYQDYKYVDIKMNIPNMMSIYKIIMKRIVFHHTKMIYKKYN